MAAVTLDDIFSLFKETDRLLKNQAQEADRRSKETDHKFQETDRQIQQTNRELQETGRELKESNRALSKLVKEQGRQIGGLGDKFGYFTEGMAMPSMERILTEQFGMTVVAPRVRLRRQGEHIEIDVLAYANGELNRAIVVEVKSRVKKEAIAQLRNIMQRFREFFPEHQDKTLLAILAGVDWDRGVEEEAHEAGFLTACIHDEIFDLNTPTDFAPRQW